MKHVETFPRSATGLDPKRVLVAVPVLNEARHISACLASLLEGDESLQHVRLIVADGGSTDSTRELVSQFVADFPNMELIDNPGRLQSAALNRIVGMMAEAHHDILVRCDAHATYPPRYILDVAERLQSCEAEALATPMDAIGETCFARAAAWVVDTPLGSGGSPHRGGRGSGYVDHGHHAGVRIDSFRKIRGYDESFSHNEDAEFDHRLRQAGGRIWLEADIRLTYRMRTSIASLARQYWFYGRGRARTYLKHRMWPRLRQVIPVANLILLLLSPPLGQLSPIFLVWPIVYFGLLLASSLFLAVKKRSACGLLAGPALAAMHISWGAGFLRQLLVGR